MNKFLLRAFVLFLSFSSIQQKIFAQWTPTSGPEGMNITMFIQKGPALFAGTSSHGVFRSADHGVTWVAANSGIENRSVFSLFYDGTYLFAGTDNGPYKSNNNGISWTPANVGMEGKFVYSFLNSGGYLFAGTIAFGLFKSNDHGSTWTDANGGALGSSSIYAMAFSAPNIVVMADNNIFYSNNNGDAWFYPPTSPFVFTTTPSFYVQGDSILLNAGFCVFRSLNSGVSWGPQIIVNDNINLSGFIKSGTKIYAGGGRSFNGGDPGVYWTKNFGSTWHQVVSNGLRSGNRMAHHFYKSGNNFLMSFDEIGVAYSNDKGLNWNYSLTGFPPASTIDNALEPAGTSLLSGTHSDGLYRTNNNGDLWTKIGTPDPFDTLSNGIIFAVLQKGSVILAGACGDGLYRSADNGASWTHITSGLPDAPCVNSLSESGTNIIIATDQGVYYSTNDGLTWNPTSISGTSYVGMGVAANGTTACAVVNRFTGGNQIYRSVNSGVTWSLVFSTFTDDFVCIASDGASHFYTGTFTSNFVSANNGLTWNSFGPGIPVGTGGFTIAVQGTNVFVGNNLGIYFSNNSAASFVSKNEGLDPDPNRSVEGLAISGDYIFAGLFQDAVWRRPLSDFGIVPRLADNYATDNIQAEILKYSIQPNPVKDDAVLYYELNAAAKVSIIVVNASGQLMQSIWSADKDAGIYDMHINTTEFEPGTYIANIRADNKSYSLKFEVIK